MRIPPRANASASVPLGADERAPRGARNAPAGAPHREAPERATCSDLWNPTQYQKFRAERAQPFFDLLAMVERRPQPMSAIDLGCGTGELTRKLHEQLGAALTIGIDNSAKMLTSAAALAGGGLTFRQQDIVDFANEDATASARFDLIFSNAALQWIDDHPALFAKLSRRLNDGGQLAIQMPANDDHISHEAARIVARSAAFRDVLGGWSRSLRVELPETYADMLFRLGFAQQHVRLQVYPHVLAGREDVVEWVRGTLLTDYQRRVPPPLWERFVAAYRQELFRHIPDERPLFYPFKRILIRASRN